MTTLPQAAKELSRGSSPPVVEPLSIGRIEASKQPSNEHWNTEYTSRRLPPSHVPDTGHLSN